MKLMNQINQLKQLIQIFDQFHLLKRRILSKGICIFLLPFLMFQNCYLNPFVYDLLNPMLEEEKKAGLLDGGLLLALNGFSSSLYITGVIRNGSGIAQINKEYSVIASESIADSIGLTGNTESSGRFFLPIGQGNTTIRVTDAGEALVTFTLNVSGPGMVSVTSIDPPEYEIDSLFPYDPTNKPVFFDIISSTPENNGTAYFSTTTITLTFSDTLPNWEFTELESIINNNIIVSPSSITFGSPAVSGNQISIIAMVSVFDILYTMQIGPGIYSVKGTPVTPTTIRFFTQENLP